MADIVCPECGQVTTLTAIRRAADEFCPHCDYPLFWAPTALPLVAGSAASDATVRRLPGAGGRMMIGTLVCPACGELNPMSRGRLHPLRFAAAPRRRGTGARTAPAAAPATRSRSPSPARGGGCGCSSRASSA